MVKCAEKLFGLNDLENSKLFLNKIKKIHEKKTIIMRKLGISEKEELNVANNSIYDNQIFQSILSKNYEDSFNLAINLAKSIIFISIL